MGTMSIASLLGVLSISTASHWEQMSASVLANTNIPKPQEPSSLGPGNVLSAVFPGTALAQSYPCWFLLFLFSQMNFSWSCSRLFPTTATNAASPGVQEHQNALPPPSLDTSGQKLVHPDSWTEAALRFIWGWSLHQRGWGPLWCGGTVLDSGKIHSPEASRDFSRVAGSPRPSPPRTIIPGLLWGSETQWA